MKKLLFIIALFFAFSISASAQSNKVAAAKVQMTPAEAAKKDSQDLKALLSLNDTRTTDFYNLFEQKYQTLAVPDLSAERKSVLKTVIDAKIRASVDANEMAKIEANPALFTRLTE